MTIFCVFKFTPLVRIELNAFDFGKLEKDKRISQKHGFTFELSGDTTTNPTLKR